MEYKDIAQVCRDRIWTDKTQLELESVRDMKGNKKGFLRYVSNQRQAKENVGPQFNRSRDLVTKDIKKAEVLNAFFCLFSLLSFALRSFRSLGLVSGSMGEKHCLY